MARNTSSRLEDLNLTKDEVQRLGDALKKEEFRKLLCEYAREINDPVNKKQYEEEITQLESERGVDIKFVHPEPQYVIKTCFNPGGEKVFVNICSNSLVGKPTSKPSLNSEGGFGVNWSIPLLQAPPREDLDKSGIVCTVYDVVFHPDTHALSAKDRRFRNFVEETALNAVEETYSVKLDRNSIKRPRMKFKGIPRATVIRTRRPESDTDKEEDDNVVSQFPYPYDMPPKEAPPVRQLKQKKMELKKENYANETYITPKYTLKQSSDVDMANYEQNLLAHHDITVPQRLVLIADLPCIKSSSELELDLEAQKVSLTSKGKRRYKLELKLPYPVQENQGTAKFDQDAGKLLVTMLVDREKAVMKKPQTPEGDSGIESDMGCGRTSSGEEEESKVSEKDPIASLQGQEKDKANSSGQTYNNMIPEDSLTLSDDCLKCESENVSESNLRDKMIGKIFQVDVSKAESEKVLLKDESVADKPGNYSKGGEKDGEAMVNTVVIPKVPLIEEICEKIGSCTSSKCVKETDDNVKDLIRPGIPYLMPPFSCSCLHELESTSVTFVLNVKNVDPSSIDKQVKYIGGIQKNVSEAKVSSSSNMRDLLPENGSVCNEYRTVGEIVSSLPFSSSNVNGTDLTNNQSSENVETSRPENVCTNEVNISSYLPKEQISIGSDSNPSSTDATNSTSPSVSSQLPENFMPEKAEIPGANLPAMNGFVGKKLCDNLKESLVIKEDNASKSTPQEEGFVTGDQEMICFQIIFSSIGAGYFPQNYSFCVSFPSSQWPNIDPESLDFSPISVEVWDNNVEVQWRKTSSKNEVFDCFAGQNPWTLKSYKLPPFEDKEIELESFSESDLSSSNVAAKENKEVLTEKQSDYCGASKGDKYDRNGQVTSSAKRRKMFKERTLSESSVESNSTKQAMKGILKRRGRMSLGRSLSESSGGEEYSWTAPPHISLSSSATSYPSLSDDNRLTLGECPKEEEEEYDEEEEDDEEDGEKVKKIVRFSDVISQKTFRSNSSILGQRKKNQRKMKNKKRAAERRASESENSVDEAETGSDKSNSDCVSDLSPPQKAEIPLPTDSSNSKGKAKGASKKKGGANKGKGKKVDVSQKADDSSGSAASPTYEFKSDLIFQLEL